MVSASRATMTTSRPAIAAAWASAVPHAPPPITATRSSGMKLTQRPASAGAGVERIAESERETLRACPGNHHAVVGAERRRRNYKLRLDRAERSADRLVGRNAASDDQH